MAGAAVGPEDGIGDGERTRELYGGPCRPLGATALTASTTANGSSVRTTCRPRTVSELGEHSTLLARVESPLLLVRSGRDVLRASVGRTPDSGPSRARGTARGAALGSDRARTDLGPSLGLPTWVNYLAFDAPTLEDLEVRKQRW